MKPVAGALRAEFRGRSGAAGVAHERHLHELREERDRRERRENQRQQSIEDLADLSLAMLSQSEIASFRAELNVYDTATVIALQENERDLEQAQRHVDEIVLRAHVMPDGRRVFKTEDGTRVFDEFGAEVDASIVSVEEIANERPRYETYRSAREDVDRLVTERRTILEYQRQLDRARERLDSGDMVRTEYEQLRRELKETMPDRVRAHVPEALDSTADKSASTLSVSDFSDDMVPQTGAGTPTLSRSVTAPVLGR